MTKAIIFDMYGVLTDTEAVSARAWRECGLLQQIRDMEQTILDCIGLNENDMRAYFAGKYGEEFAYREFKKNKSRICEEILEKEGIPVKPGARELLEYLRREGWEIGLASSTKGYKIRARLEKIGLLSYFGTIVAGDMVTHSKPHPEIYLRACEEMGVKPQETFAIEDSPNGIRSACAAGMKVLIVPDLIQPGRELVEMAAGCFASLDQVREYLEEK